MVKIEKSGSGPVVSRGDAMRTQNVVGDRKSQFDSITLQMQKESIKGSDEQEISQKDASLLLYN